MDIFLKLLIGFGIFFIGVTLNVSIMRKVSGKPKGFMPPFSFITICIGLFILVWMASSIRVTL